jgi:hypothetical protein
VVWLSKEARIRMMILIGTKQIAKKTTRPVPASTGAP